MKMKKNILILIVIFAQYKYVSAQQDISSLRKQIKYIKEDTSGVRLLNNLANAFYNDNENDSCAKYGAMELLLTDKLLNTDAVKGDAIYNMQCKKLKAQAIENIAGGLHYDTKKGLDTLQAALQLWNETGDKKGMASAYSRIGDFFSFQDNYVYALRYFDTSLILYKQVNDTSDMGYKYDLIALNQRYMRNFGDALENNINALTIGKEIKDTNLITRSLLAIGFVYMHVKNFIEAIKNQQAALSIFIKRRDSFGIATVYNDFGVTDTRAGNLDVALKDHTTALMIRKQINDYNGIANSCGYISQILLQQGNYHQALMNNIEDKKYAKLSGSLGYILDSYNSAGDIYMEMNDDENALKNYDTLLRISRNNNDLKRQAEALESISGIFLKQGKPNDAIVWLQKAVAISTIDDFTNQKIIYGNLSEAYAKTGDYKNAYESSIKYKRFSDSVASIEKQVKIAGITQQLEFENRQALQEASQDKQLAMKQSEINIQKLVRNITIAGLLVVIVLAMIFFIRFREKRKLNIALGQTLDNLKSTQAQLIQTEKMASFGQLTAGIAHEIQNPLNFVNNFSEVNKELMEELQIELRAGNTEEAIAISNDIKDNGEKINQHGRRADAIVKGMLQHSRSRSGVQEPTDINALANEYLRLSYSGMRARDKSFNATMKIDFDESLSADKAGIGKINIMAQDISRVLLNLFNNAFYAVNEKGKQQTKGLPTAKASYTPTISVRTKKINNKVELTVTDNGNGIPQKVIDKIFQPFFTTKPTGEGTGLGLSLSYDIVKAHGGEIKVVTKEGEGSEFIIILPVA
jgi:two-component system NtrC family sensor kinase